MNEKEFNSQICTTIEQSKRLLDLGLKTETADMVIIRELAYDKVAHCTYDADTYMIRPINYLDGERHRGHIHAWSLHRLIELCRDVEALHMWSLEKLNYDRLIQGISLAIKYGEFNKEYLNENTLKKIR